MWAAIEPGVVCAAPQKCDKGEQQLLDWMLFGSR